MIEVQPLARCAVVPAGAAPLPYGEDPALTATIHSDPTSLYRLFSSDGRLLYIGIAGNPGRRFEQHRGTKPWWPEVARIDLEHHRSREAAAAAEIQAIQTEAPAYNSAHNPHRSDATLAVRGPHPGRPGATEARWSFRARFHGESCVSELYLSPEINLTPCADNVWQDVTGEEQLRFYIEVLRSYQPDQWAADRVPISWFVVGPGICEAAPLPSEPENFLTFFTWPRNIETGERLTWPTLPMQHRFPGLMDALGWEPNPFLEFAPIRTIVGDRFR